MVIQIAVYANTHPVNPAAVPGLFGTTPTIQYNTEIRQDAVSRRVNIGGLEDWALSDVQAGLDGIFEHAIVVDENRIIEIIQTISGEPSTDDLNLGYDILLRLDFIANDLNPDG